MNSILKSALITEKSFNNASAGKYTFCVTDKASKKDIALAVEDAFDVDVVSVNTAGYDGKVKLSKRGRGRRDDWKKAIVTLMTGQKIDLFEIEEEKDKKLSKTAGQQDSKTARK